MPIKNIIVVGDGKVGKSCFVDIMTIKHASFEKRYLPNFGVRLSENSKYRLYDSPGNDRYWLEEMNVKIDLCIIMYDLSNKSSYDNIDKWKKYVETRYKVPNIIVGNKKDLYHSDRKIKNKSIEISCKKKYNIEDLIKKIDSIKPFINKIKKLDTSYVN
tara:strand:- start:86 stop:562 length:477 start_codon:yes stop_codon:yes gene_type:complete